MKRLLHWIAHRLRWQHGTVVTKWHEGELWIGFQCATCGKITGAEIVPTHIIYPERK